MTAIEEDWMKMCVCVLLGSMKLNEIVSDFNNGPSLGWFNKSSRFSQSFHLELFNSILMFVTVVPIRSLIYSHKYETKTYVYLV